jgi:transcriptional regulator with XRE-family HTH domain
MDMNDRISLARKEAGFNKSELARNLDVTPTSCSSWELPSDNRNNSRPSVNNLGRLALILNVRFEWLATGRGPMSLTPTARSQPKTPLSQSDRAQSLLSLYRMLPASQRSSMLDFIRLVSGNMLDKPSPPAARRRSSKPARKRAANSQPVGSN